MSTFNLLLCVVLVEIHEEHLALHKCMVEKGMSILIALQILQDLLLWYFTKTRVIDSYLKVMQCEP